MAERWPHAGARDLHHDDLSLYHLANAKVTTTNNLETYVAPVLVMLCVDKT